MTPVVDTPLAGFYALRLARGGIEVAVHIWFGCPVIDGEEQDRSPRWCVELDGETTKTERDKESGYECRVPLDPIFDNVWPFCAGRPIDQTEFAFLKRRAETSTSLVQSRKVLYPAPRAKLMQVSTKVRPNPCQE